MTAADAPPLALRAVSKRFGQVVALDGATFVLRRHTVHALLGENGAGKTTLMRIAFGLTQPDSGTIERDGVVVSFARPADAIASGIGMVHQHFSLVPEMTVAENLTLGRRGLLSKAAAVAYTRLAQARFGIALDPHARVSTLSVAAQQRVEIAKALLRNAQVLILDEPTAVLAPSEAAELLEQLRLLARAGTAVVLITHKLTDALRVSDDITVLRGGQMVLTSATAAATMDGLVNAMLGTRPSRTAGHATLSSKQGDDVLVANGVSVVRDSGVTTLADASVSVKAGEILGVAGVEGSGQRELLRVLAGRLAPTSGHVIRPPIVGFVPEDRHRDAVIVDFDLVSNVALADAGARVWMMPWPEFARTAETLVREYHITARDVSAPMRSLSGGNQQRFVVARELRRAGAAIVVENPTRGLDVRAAEQVLIALRTAAAAGTAVVVYSSDIDELLTIADRTVVCFAGHVHEVKPTIEEVGRAMVGARPTP